jgi:hypothetical protein
MKGRSEPFLTRQDDGQVVRASGQQSGRDHGTTVPGRRA